MADEIRIGLSIDTSGLSAAQSAAQSSADAIASSYQKVGTASSEAAAFSLRMKAALDEYNATAAQGKAASEALAKALQQAQQSGVSYVVALEAAVDVTRQQIAAASDSALAEEADAAAARGAAAAKRELGMQSNLASTEMRVFEGSTLGSARAAGMFAAQSLGLGPILSAAFPIVGAVAMGMMLVQLVEGISKFAQEAQDLADELGVGWMDGAILQLEGYGKKIQEEEKLTEKFQGEVDSFKQHSKEMGFETIGRNEGPAAEATARAQAVLQEKQALEAMMPVLKERLDAAKQLADAESRREKFNPQMVGMPEKYGLSDNPEVAGEQAKTIQAQIESMNAKIQEDASKATELSAQAAKLGEPKTKIPKAGNAEAEEQVRQQEQLAKAQIEAAHAGDDALPPAQKITAELEKQLALHLAEEQAAERMASLKEEKSNAVQVRQAQDAGSIAKANAEVAILANEELTRTWEEGERAREEAIKKQDAADKLATEEWKKRHEEQMRQLQDETNETIKSATERENATKHQIEYEEKIGILKPKQGAQEQIAEVNTTESAQVGALKTQQSQYDPALGEKEATEYKSIQDKIDAIAQQSADKRAQIMQQETLREVQAWQQAYQQMTSAVVSATNTWMTTNNSFGNSFIDAGKHLAVEFIDDLIKMGAKWVETEAMKFAVHEGWVAAQKTTDATAAASSLAITSATNAAKIGMNVVLAQSEAGVAAATAAAEAAPGGPIAAAAAGAEMLAAMTPFVVAASLDTGGMVPGRAGQPVPILAHGGEEVVQGPVAAAFAQAQQNGGGLTGRAGHSFQSHSTINATVLDSRGLEGFARRAADVNLSQMRRGARRLNATM